MYKSKRLVKNLVRLILPILLLVVLAVAGASVWLVQQTSLVKPAPYLMKPDKYGQLSSKAAQITDETWPNGDGTSSRGWLLRGNPGSPGIILFHKYGADRSYLLNLGVKLSESSNFTVLMPDLRGHGESPLIKRTSFGAGEANDATAAIQFLHTLKSPEQAALVSDIGLYGVELGAIAAITAAAKDPGVKAIVLDDVPQDSDAVLASAIGRRFPFASSITSKFASLGTSLYFYDGSYKVGSPCEQARTLVKRKVLLLAGVDAPEFQDSTQKLSKCFPAGTQIDGKFDLSPSAYTIVNASIEQAEGYDQRVIGFFMESLAAPVPPVQ
ncbi:MAG: alpha/beta hydrolase [Acidobacteriota bacterium]